MIKQYLNFIFFTLLIFNFFNINYAEAQFRLNISKAIEAEIAILDIFDNESQYSTEANKYAIAAAKHGDIPVMEYAIINLGFDVNSHNSLVNPTVLVLAVTNNQYNMIQYLLTQDIDLHSESNIQAMIEATIKGKLEIIIMLANKGMTLEFFNPFTHHGEKTNVGELAKKFRHFEITRWFEKNYLNNSNKEIQEL